MTRSIFALTTALTLSLPLAAAAQTDTRADVRDILDRYGYNPERVEMLSNAEIAEIYLTATSEDRSDVRVLLSSLELDEMPMADGDVARTTDVDAVAMDVLEQNGYPGDAINYLTNAEVSDLYLAATSEDQSNVERIIAGFDLPSDESGSFGTTYDFGDSTERYVANMLMEMGYSAEQIATLDQNEMAEIYIASTSGDQTEIEAAVEGAFSS